MEEPIGARQGLGQLVTALGEAGYADAWDPLGALLNPAPEGAVAEEDEAHGALA